MTNSTETVESVLAEWHAHIDHGCACCQPRDFADRLAAAHKREVSESHHALRVECAAVNLLHEKAEARAEAADGLLRECRPLVDTCPDLIRPGGDELGERVDAFLSEQAGERENGDD